MIQRQIRVVPAETEAAALLLSVAEKSQSAAGEGQVAGGVDEVDDAVLVGVGQGNVACKSNGQPRDLVLDQGRRTCGGIALADGKGIGIRIVGEGTVAQDVRPILIGHPVPVDVELINRAEEFHRFGKGRAVRLKD